MRMTGDCFEEGALYQPRQVILHELMIAHKMLIVEISNLQGRRMYRTHAPAPMISAAAEEDRAVTVTYLDQAFNRRESTFYRHMKSYKESSIWTLECAQKNVEPVPELTLDHTSILAYPPIHSVFADGSQLVDGSMGAAAYMKYTDECVQIQGTANST